MQVSQIVTLVLLIAVIGAFISWVHLRRGSLRDRRTYTQAAPALPAFTDSGSPLGAARAAYEQARIVTVASDAKLILHRQYAGSTATRRAMNAAGMSDRRWQAAVRLLRALGIYSAHGFAPIVAEYYALRQIDRWQRVQTGRVGACPTYVAAH
jgi:hypothetical protein